MTAAWTPAPGEKCWIEGDLYGIPAKHPQFIPHDIVDALEAVTLTRCDEHIDGSFRPIVYRDGGVIAGKTSAALECLVRCGRLERVVDGDVTTARYRRVGR